MLYLRNWEKNLDFDNYYITPYFVRKDAERRLEVSSVLHEINLWARGVRHTFYKLILFCRTLF